MERFWSLVQVVQESLPRVEVWVLMSELIVPRQPINRLIGCLGTMQLPLRLGGHRWNYPCSAVLVWLDLHKRP